MLLKRSDVTIVMPNAPQTFKLYSSKSKRTSDAQTLFYWCQTLLRRPDVIMVLPNGSLTVSCPHMCWFEIEANRDSVLRDQKMLPEVWNRLLLPLVLLSISMSRKFLLKLELWSHRGVCGSIARGHHFLNACSAGAYQKHSWLRCCYWYTPMCWPQLQG